jgi:DNA-binding XRE family transcriptional regulator
MDTQNKVIEILKTGLTQQQLADLVPCGQSTISAYAKGTRGTRPSMQIGMRLASIFEDRCHPQHVKGRHEIPSFLAPAQDTTTEGA